MREPSPLHLTIPIYPYLSSHLVPDRLVILGALIVLRRLIIVLLQGLLERSLDRVLEVHGEAFVEDGDDEHQDHEEVNQSADKLVVLNILCIFFYRVGSDQANAFLHEDVNQSAGKLVLLNNLCIFCHQVSSEPEQAIALLHGPTASE